MTRFGYTLMTEQSGPRSLVDQAGHAERAGFDFEVMSDHYFPWLSAQGHASYAWSVLGAGENLNEHVVGRGWPSVDARQDMLVEAMEIIRELFGGEVVTYDGEHFRVDSARLWDLPDQPVALATAVSSEKSVRRFAPLSDHLVAVQPEPDLVSTWNGVEGAPHLGEGAARAIGQIPICWDPDRDTAIARAHDQFRWFAGGWAVNSDLPTTAGFAGATQFVRPEDVADNIPCGPDLDAVVEAVSAFWEAGFTDVALVQVGDESTGRFLGEAAGPLLAALREASPGD